MLGCCICVFQNKPIVMNKTKDEMSVATHLEEKNGELENDHELVQE